MPQIQTFLYRLPAEGLTALEHSLIKRLTDFLSLFSSEGPEISIRLTGMTLSIPILKGAVTTEPLLNHAR